MDEGCRLGKALAGLRVVTEHEEGTSFAEAVEQHQKKSTIQAQGRIGADASSGQRYRRGNRTVENFPLRFDI